MFIFNKAMAKSGLEIRKWSILTQKVVTEALGLNF
jgi:hypothetical protein